LLLNSTGVNFDLFGSGGDHLIPHRPFPIGSLLEPSLYLCRFARYSTANVTLWLTSKQRLRSFILVPTTNPFLICDLL